MPPVASLTGRPHSGGALADLADKTKGRYSLAADNTGCRQRSFLIGVETKALPRRPQSNLAAPGDLLQGGHPSWVAVRLPASGAMLCGGAAIALSGSNSLSVQLPQPRYRDGRDMSEEGRIARQRPSVERSPGQRAGSGSASASCARPCYTDSAAPSHAHRGAGQHEGHDRQEVGDRPLYNAQAVAVQADVGDHVRIEQADV